jgi:hypothetical protein
MATIGIEAHLDVKFSGEFVSASKSDTVTDRFSTETRHE